MDFKEIYDKAVKETENLKLEQARLEQQVSTLLQELDMQDSENLAAELEELSKTTTEKIKSLEQDISECIDKLKEYE